MTVTTFVSLKGTQWPSNGNDAEVRFAETSESDVLPGMGVYFSADKTIKKATSSAAFAGVAGKKYDHDPDTVYTSGTTGIPVIMRGENVEVPICTVALSAAKYIGTPFSIDATNPGYFIEATPLISGMVVRQNETAGASDTRIFAKFV